MMWFIGNCEYCVWERDHGDTPQHLNHPYVNWIGDVTKSELFHEFIKTLESEDWESLFK